MKGSDEVSRGGVPPIRTAPNFDKLLTVQDLIAELTEWDGDAQVIFRSTSDGGALRFYCFRSPEPGVLEINLNE
ncbi:hypothetical protein [Bradyrhizobium sp. SYSU BS000235]|uniref:hypothetical protein n=1 Tax=Bradyrhizobium sp. SYSU BS000235 TaxID=3411332 RepID=UPI003C721273